MGITVRTLYPNQLYQLRITGVSADVTVLSYTFATRALSSSYFPASAIAILQSRWDNLVSGLSASLVEGFAPLLANLIHISDPSGVLGIFYAADGSSAYLYLTGLSALETYSINLGIPNSVELWLTGGTAVAPPI